MFGRDKVNDPYNTMGDTGRPPEKKPPVRQDAASKERIRRYKEAVAANYAAGHPLPGGVEAYRALTRSDCAILWRPGCPEASDPKRRP